MRFRKLLSSLAIIFFSLLFLNTNYASADLINRIDIVADIQDDGSLKVTQTWNVKTNEGTEYYIPMQNINHMTVSDFKVTDNTGRVFEFVDNWNIDWSFNQKAYKNGINKLSKGIELNFGKSDYSITEYKLEYTLHNAVQSFSDMDGFNIRFINEGMSPAPRDFSIIIRKDGVALSSNNASIWAFGYEGDINFTNGEIVAKNTSSFTKSNNATILVGLQKGIITPKYIGSGTFDNLKELALEDSDYYESEGWSFRYIFQLLFGGIVILGIWLHFMFKSVYKNRPCNVRELSDQDVGYYRDIPLHNNLVLIYYFSSFKFGRTRFTDFISAMFLKWINEQAMIIEDITEEKGVIFKRDVTATNLTLVKEPNFASKTEAKLWNMVRIAAGSNMSLEKNEFKKYTSQNPSRFEEFIDLLAEEGKQLATKYGYLGTKEKYFSEVLYLTDSAKEEYKNVAGFKKYLEDFTLLDERGVKEVALWDNYLIIATLMGIGEKVLKDMKHLVPSYNFGGSDTETTVIDTWILYNLTRDIARAGHTGYTSHSSSRSSGFGGSSSLGGGGGFSGGGFGGGSR